MVRRRIALVIEVQEARPNWSKTFTRVEFPLSFEEDKLRIDRRVFDSALNALVVSLKDWANENNVELI